VVTETLDVRGMHCDGCEARVRDAVAALPGVERAVAEHIGDLVEVTYDPALVDRESIRAAIAGAGFAA
jgi:copper chaperone CopZ